MMYERNIKVIALPPHISHWAQPLDKNPFSTFKEQFNKEIRKFLRKSGGRALQKTEYMSVFNVAWVKAMTPQNIKAGFKRTGIWPPNPDVIPSVPLFLFQVFLFRCTGSVCNYLDLCPLSASSSKGAAAAAAAAAAEEEEEEEEDGDDDDDDDDDGDTEEAEGDGAKEEDSDEETEVEDNEGKPNQKYVWI